VSRAAKASPPPQPERLPEQEPGLLVVVAGPGPGHELAKAVQIHRLRVNSQDVAAVQPSDAGPAGIRQDVPQAGEVGVQRGAGLPRKLVPPDPAGQPFGRHRLVGVDDQGGQHALLPGMPQGHQPSVNARLNRAEHAQFHRHGDHPQTSQYP
jgi:hypothetical protein